MAEDSRMQPFDEADDRSPTDRDVPTEADEQRARERWAASQDQDRTLQQGQARRLLNRRPLIKGIAAGASLLFVSREDLQAALEGAGAAIAEAARSPDQVPVLQGPTSPPPTMPPPTTTTTSPPPTMPPPTTTTTSPPPTQPPGNFENKEDDRPRRGGSNTKPGKDHPEISGAVREIRLDANPPYIVVTTSGGPVYVYLTADGVAFARNNVNLGDLITAIGTSEGEGTLEDADLQPYKP